MRDVVKRYSVVTETGGLAGKDIKIGANRAPLRLAFRTGRGEMRERYFRPVDPPLVVSAKERADRVDEREFHNTTPTA